MDNKKRYAVFSIKKSTNGSVWVRAGSAFINKDASMNIYLDVLPLDGHLHVREAVDKRDAAAGSGKTETVGAPSSEWANQSAGGH